MRSTTVTRFEFVVAILLTLILIAVHFVFWFHAGSLWRDEISSLALATKPTFSEFWRSLKFDPFPAGYFLLLRVWDFAGLDHSDLSLRAVGFVVGLSLAAALWIACYLIDKSPPLWPLALFALNPLTLETADSLRPYGFSLIWIVLAFGLIARMTLGGLTTTVALCALIAAVLSVQSNFTNALILFSLAMGGVVALLAKRPWSKIFLVLGIGIVAALSLLPYLPIVTATKHWSNILANENNIANVVAVARDAIGSSGALAEWTWLALSAATIGFAVFVTFVRSSSTVARDRIILAAIVLLVAAADTIWFLCAAKYLVFPRYFLAVLAIGALCFNIFWNAIANRTAIRVFGLCLALAVTVTSLRPLSGSAHTRMTNCDEIAATLEKRAVADDLIIVTSPLYGISFQRYYHGEASWTTVPPVRDLTLHRWDLLKQAMAHPDPVPELVSRAQDILQSGHKIFLVGKLGPAPTTEPASLPAAPNSQFSWQMEAYTNQWKSELTYWFEHHALHGTDLAVDGNQLVNPFEQLGLFEISGLRAP
jgi:hypothetical protein